MKPEKEPRNVRTKRTTRSSKAKEQDTSLERAETQASTTKTKSVKTPSSEEISSQSKDQNEMKWSSEVKPSKSAVRRSVKDSAETTKKAKISKKGKDSAEEHLETTDQVNSKGQRQSGKKAIKRKAADATESGDRKRKAGKKKTPKLDQDIRGLGMIDQVEEGGDFEEGNKKKARKPKKAKETVDVKTESSVQPKTKRKALDAEVATKQEKKQKVGPKTKRSVEEPPAKKPGAKKGGAKKGVAKEGAAEEEVVVKEEFNGETECEVIPEMAKEVVSKAAKFVGAHMSIAGGLDNAVKGAVATGSKAFALFLRSQRQWAAKPLEDKSAAKFRQACQDHGFPPHLILPHGSYLMNCGSPSEETLRKSREVLVDELNRCEKLGLTRYNFHPGSSCGQITVEECLDRIGESINKVHQQTNKVMTVIENMCCQGSTVGGRFEELSGIIKRVSDKSRIGVCLDTCHAFAAGFDLSTEAGYEKMMSDFDRIVGLKYLVAAHLNDSKGKVGSHLDRHEIIGRGQIGLKAFRRLMNDPRFDNIPLILETPVEDGMDDAKAIKLLNSLVGKK